MAFKQRLVSNSSSTAHIFRKAVLVSTIFAASALASTSAEAGFTPPVAAAFTYKGKASAKKEFRSDESGMDLIAKPYEMSGGKVKKVTIAVQVFEVQSGRSAYLVSRMPQKSVNSLNSYIAKLPEDEREQAVDEWITKQKKTMIAQYIASRKPSQFTFDLSGNVTRPKPAPRKERTAVTETVDPYAEPEKPKPEPKKRTPVVTEPTDPYAKSKKSDSNPLFSQVRGEGSEQKPYVIRLKANRGTVGTGARKLKDLPRLEMGLWGEKNMVYLELDLTASQLANSKYGETLGRIRKIVEEVLKKHGAEHNLTVDIHEIQGYAQGVSGALMGIKRAVMADDPLLKKYFETH